MTTSEAQETHRQAVTKVGPVMAKITAADLNRATPCAEWTLQNVIEHMTDLNNWFGEAVTTDNELQGNASSPVLDAYTASAQFVSDAFSQASLTDSVVIPKAGISDPMPVDIVISLLTHEVLAHGWDVAKAMDLPYEPEAGVLSVASQVVTGIPDEARAGAQPAFGPILPTTDSTDAFVKYLAVIGRSAHWHANEK